MIKFKDFKIGDFVTFYALVHDCKLRHTVNQTPYYGLSISDGDLIIDARVWDVNLKKDIDVGTIYKFEAKINDFGGKMQAIISSITDVSEGEVDWHDFYRFAPLTEEELRDNIFNYLEKVKNPILHDLAKALISKVEASYFTFPAGVTMHHNYIGGLAYHTYSMLKQVDTYLEIYPSLNQDLMYTGILLHDIGKTKELTNAKLPSYSQIGNLLGHLVIGAQMIALEAENEGVSNSEEVRALSHLIVSHHGEMEYGSPKEPLMMEAFALYLIDTSDSKMAAIHEEVDRTDRGELTRPIATLSKRSFYIPKLYVPKIK